MITLSAQQAGGALGLGPLATPVIGISIDSRSLRPGDLFVALRGERFDGHEYVRVALAAGACGAVVERERWAGQDGGGVGGAGSGAGAGGAAGGGARGEGGGPIYAVADTLSALGSLAREVRRLSGVTVFGITGSAGKTSTKDLLRAMVGRARKVVATSGNQNNEVGVPLTLLSIEPGTEAVVVEMGMRGRGQIGALAAVAEPDVGIVTNVHPVHLELLGSLESIAEAKAELVHGLKPGGAAVVPADCGALEPCLAGWRGRLVRFAVGLAASGAAGVAGAVAARAQAAPPAQADVVGWLEEEVGGGHLFVVDWPGGQTRVATGYLPRHTLENAVAAIAACYAAGLPVQECAAGIADVEFSKGRGQMIEVGGVCLVDDTYNANPAAVRAAVQHLISLAAERGGRAVAVLGDMLELGPEAERFHEETGAAAAEAGVAALWAVGPLSAATARGFRRWWEAHEQAGGHWSVEHLASADDAAPVVAGLRAGDVVLLKASRSVRLENVVIRVVDEAGAGRWGGGAAYVGDSDHGTWEMRHC